MYTNNNLLRDIISQEDNVGQNEWNFMPSDAGIMNTGIIEVTVAFASPNILVDIDFLANDPRDDFFNDLGYVKVGGINFGADDSPVVSDTKITITKSFSVEKYDSELLAFQNTLSIEIGAKP